MKAAILFSVILSTVPLLTGCDPPGRPNPADRPVPADQVMDFDILYGQNCAGCHGANGTLGPAPPLNDPLFRAIVPESDLKDVIAKGRSRTLMPAFARDSGGALSKEQIQVLVKEIKGIPYRVARAEGGGKGAGGRIQAADAGEPRPRWGIPPAPPANLPAYRQTSSQGNLEKGNAVFARACAECHGSQGKGVQRDGETVHAINDRVFLALISDQALRRLAITGRPDLGMPPCNTRPGNAQFTPMTEGDLDDLSALFASWRHEN